MKQSQAPNSSINRNPATLNLHVSSEDDQYELVARAFTKPEVRAASVIQKLDGQLMDINCLMAELESQNAAVQSGDLSRAESILGSQAHTLDALFANLARRSITNLDAGHGGPAERLMRLALKAQAQAVRTIEALSGIKRPKNIAYVAQANISHGHQQVNNGCAQQADNSQISINKLSQGQNDGQYPNSRAPSVVGAINPRMATLNALDRS